MSCTALELGDRVMYVDGNQIEWGPWEVIELSGETVTVRLEAEIEHEVPADDVRKSAVMPPEI